MTLAWMRETAIKFAGIVPTSAGRARPCFASHL
jgi:hypothetical protein